MLRIERINIEGHRRLRNVSTELRPLTVMIGANGSGKTSLMEVLQILSRGARKQLGDTIRECGGLGEILTRDRAQKWIAELWIDLGRANQDRSNPESLTTLRYYAELAPLGNYGYRVENEVANAYFVEGTYDDPRHQSVFASAGTYPFDADEVVVDAQELGLVRYRRKEAVLRELTQFIEHCNLFRPIDISSRSQVRTPQQIAPVEHPGADGEFLLTALFSLRETANDRYEQILDSVRAAHPDFERLDFPPVAAGMVTLAWKDRQYSKPFYPNQLSEGTLRFLWLATVLAMAKPNEVILIDEPETSLHPRQLSLLAELLREAALQSNLIVATHSDRLVRALNPEEVLVVNVEDGEARFTWGDSLDIEHWLQDYTLEQLWQMGVLGGNS